MLRPLKYIVIKEFGSHAGVVDFGDGYGGRTVRWR